MCRECGTTARQHRPPSASSGTIFQLDLINPAADRKSPLTDFGPYSPSTFGAMRTVANPGLNTEPGGSARCYWNRHGRQVHHPTQNARTWSDRARRDASKASGRTHRTERCGCESHRHPGKLPSRLWRFGSTTSPSSELAWWWPPATPSGGGHSLTAR